MISFFRGLSSFAAVLLAAAFLWADGKTNSGANQFRFTRDEKRARFISELKEPTLVDFVAEPTIEIPQLFMKEDSLPKDWKSSPESENIEKIFELQKEEEFAKAYILADKTLSKHKNSTMSEWLKLLKADLMFQVQNSKEEKKYALATEEYQDFLREFPLNTEAPRVLYQIALGQLRQNFALEVESTVARALKDFGQSELAPYYHLILGEQAFVSKDDPKANYEFSLVIQKYPQHRAAVDAAFRKAFIVFRKGDYAQTLKIFEDLERFHSKDFDQLKMESNPERHERFSDRVVYAEAVYQTGRYKDAAKLFQDLSNIFQTESLTPYLLIRLADTYLQRGRYHAATELYEDVRQQFKSSVGAAHLAQIRLADAYFLFDPFSSSRYSESFYLDAYEKTTEAKVDQMAALALSKLAAFHLYNKTYVKAKAVLEAYRKQFEKSLNQSWVDTQYARLIELQVQDYYQQGDYLAALATFLISESQQADQLKDSPVLLKLADASMRLGLLEKASQILNRVVYLDRTQIGRQEALLRLVDISIRRNELKKASERLRRFNFAYPKTSFAYFYEQLWGDLYGALGNIEQSLTHYERAVKVARAYPEKLFDLRFVYLRMANHYQKLLLPLRAIEAYEKYTAVVSERRKNPFAKSELTKKDDYLYKTSRYRIADLYFDMKDYVRALDAYRAVSQELKEEPFVSHSRYRMGECFLSLDDRKAAVAAFESVNSSDPNNLWAVAAKDYVESVKMEAKYGIRIFN